MVSAMDLTPVESRVLGALLEKAATTPEYYPLSTQSLVTACNQSLNRDPVMQLTESEVLEAVHSLRERALIRSVKRPGDRVMKHQHDLDRAYGLAEAGKAVLAVLLLRGPQTPGELRSRTERYAESPSSADVEAALDALAAREFPLVVRLERRPGQKEERWAELLTDASPDTGDPEPPAFGPSRQVSLSDRLTLLEDEVATLRSELTRLWHSLGEEP